LDDISIYKLRRYGFEKNNFFLGQKEIETINYYAGNFPFLNQIVCKHLFDAKMNNSEVNKEELEQNLRPFYQSLWDNRREDERKLLQQSLKSKQNIKGELQFALHELLSSGLIKKEGDLYRPFSNFFSYLIDKHFTIEFKETFIQRIKRLFQFEFEKIKNPYTVGPALKRDIDLFFGRQDAFDSIEKLIEKGHRTIVCYGLRRSGKTSLLYMIKNKGFSDNRLIPVYFDMQGVDDEKHFYKRLSESIAERMKYSNTDYPKGFGEFRDWLNIIREALEEKVLVLMIDEFEAIQQRVEDGKISKGIFANIRHLIQHEEKLIFLFCGTHQFEEMRAGYWYIFFNTAIYYKISYLSRKDSEDLIKKPVEGQMSYDDLAVEQILKMTHGQPYLTQMICHSLVNDLNDKRKNHATINDVDDVVEKIISQGGEHFSEHIWQQSDRLGRLILSSAADELINKHLESISFDALYDKVRAISRKFSRKDCLEVANKFVSQDILFEKNMNYSFVMGLFKKWIGLRHPLPQVREEI